MIRRLWLLVAIARCIHSQSTILAGNNSSPLLAVDTSVRLSCETDTQWFFCLWHSPSEDVQCAIQYDQPTSVCKENARVQLIGGTNYCDIEIQVRPEDHGRWMCLVNDIKNFDAKKKYVELNVGIQSVLQVEISGARETEEDVIETVEGDTIDIRCSASGGYPAPSLTWYGPPRPQENTSIKVFEASTSNDPGIHTVSVWQRIRFVPILEDTNKTISCMMMQTKDGTVAYTRTYTYRLNVEKRVLVPGGPLIQGVSVMSGVLILIILVILTCTLAVVLLVRRRARKKKEKNLLQHKEEQHSLFDEDPEDDGADLTPRCYSQRHNSRDLGPPPSRPQCYSGLVLDGGGAHLLGNHHKEHETSRGGHHHQTNGGHSPSDKPAYNEYRNHLSDCNGISRELADTFASISTSGIPQLQKNGGPTSSTAAITSPTTVVTSPTAAAGTSPQHDGNGNNNDVKRFKSEREVAKDLLSATSGPGEQEGNCENCDKVRSQYPSSQPGGRDETSLTLPLLDGTTVKDVKDPKRTHHHHHPSQDRGFHNSHHHRSRSLSTSDLSLSYSAEDLTKSCRLLNSNLGEERLVQPVISPGSVPHLDRLPCRTLVNPTKSLASLDHTKTTKRRRRKTGPTSKSTNSVFDCEEGCFEQGEHKKSQQIVTMITGPVVL